MKKYIQSPCIDFFSLTLFQSKECSCGCLSTFPTICFLLVGCIVPVTILKQFKINETRYLCKYFDPEQGGRKYVKTW